MSQELRHLKISFLSFLLFVLFGPKTAQSQLADLQPSAGSISGYVVDADGAAIPHATVRTIGTSPNDLHVDATDDSGFFRFMNLKPGVDYQVTATAKGFSTATVMTAPLTAGADVVVTGLKLKPAADETVEAASEKEVALEAVHEEEQQRVLGILPNFYVVYSRTDEVPLTSVLKYKLALRATVDPITALGVVALAGVDQATNSPAYVQGAKGYGERVGYVYAGTASDVLIGSAVLPSLLHQDPRYYYMGSGSKKSRFLHAISNTVLCKGDNGHTQFNISTIGGDLASGALSEIYSPRVNRGVGLLFTGGLSVTALRVANSLLQEFLYNKLTTRAKPEP
jgi:hypothetical protein